MRPIVLVLSIAAYATLAGCASSGGSGSTTETSSTTETTVDLTFVNQTTSDVTLYVQWRREGRLESERIRLGRLAGGATRTFEVPYRGDLLALSLDLPPSPPPTATGPGTSPGARLLDAESRGGSTGPVSSVMIEPGESVGFAIRRIAPISVTTWRIE